MVIWIFSINVLLFILGLRIMVSTFTPTLFILTFFSKVISIILIMVFLFSSITKEFKLDNISLSLVSVLFMLLLGSVNYYYVIPYINVLILLALTKVEYIYTYAGLFVEKFTTKCSYNKSLAEAVTAAVLKETSLNSLIFSISVLVVRFCILI